MTISNPTNADPGTSTTFTATIVDDDPVNYVNITGDNAILENSSGKADISLSYASSSPLLCIVRSAAMLFRG
jgi:hypothetical protein